ncbi:MAG: hypothetical protein GX800_06300 [Clostridiaceae bacterium]|nr:hypothetical protein [Clostridiaceae bacterium]
MMEIFTQAVLITIAIIFITEFKDGNPFIRWVVFNQSGECDSEKIAENVTCHMRKIGKTIYKITSQYEKGKTLMEKFEKIIEREIKK